MRTWCRLWKATMLIFLKNHLSQSSHDCALSPTGGVTDAQSDPVADPKGAEQRPGPARGRQKMTDSLPRRKRP